MSAYLSLLHLDGDEPQVRVDLRDVSELHRTIMSAFADIGGGGRARAELASHRFSTRVLDASEHRGGAP